MPGQALELSQLTADHDVTAVQGPLHTGPSRAGHEPEDLAPRSLGRYVIVAELGAGGMGRVFRAYDPSLEREVALKLLRRMTRDARARMLREAKAMAQLCHPNVLPIYDVASEGQRLFIAMELVRGQSMREWLDTGARPWWEVLEVFVAAARGLAAAHAAGLVHRDFKPGNVLIGDDGRVRVMDFGLARGCPSHSAELDSSGSSESWSPQSDDSVSGLFPARFRMTESHDVLASFGDDLTAVGTVVGTPAYMAPEQHVGHPADPRSDQYGFCVALWEALYGRRPFEGKPHDDWYRIKSTTMPRVDPGRVVPRWLHAVVLRGLAPRPSQRYPSMLALLQAVARGRRCRRSVSLSLMAAVALIGLGGALHQAGSAATLCSGARDKLAGIWDGATAAEAEHAVQATGVAYARDTWARVAPRLDDYAERWRAAYEDACEATHVRHEQPEALMDARMRCLDERRRSLRALVRTLAEADPQVVERAALAVGGLPSIDACADPEHVRAQAPPPLDPALAFEVETAEEELARIKALVDAGRTKHVEDDARAVLSRAEALGHPPLEVRARLQLGALEEDLGRYEDSKEHLEHTYFAAQREGLDELQARAAIQLIHVHGSRLGHPEDGERWERFARAALQRVHDPAVEASYLNNAGLLAGDRGDYDTAIARLERALELREQRWGTDHPHVASVLNNLALMHDARGHYDEAAALHERALEIRERVLGPRHPHVATSLLNLSNVHQTRARYDQALELRQRALEIYEGAYGRHHPHTASALVNLATTYEAMGQRERALERYGEAIPIFERAQGIHHPNVAATLANAGNVHRELGDWARARAQYERALEILERSLGPDDRMVAITLANLGSLAIEQGDLATAGEHLERALRITEATAGSRHPLAAMLHAHRGLVLSARGDHEQALRLHRHALEIRRELLGPRHPETAASLLHVGVALLDAGRPRDALEPLQQATEILAEHGDQAAAWHEARFGLARAWWETDGDRTQALATVREAQAALQELPGDHRGVLEDVDAWLATHTRRSTRAR